MLVLIDLQILEKLCFLCFTLYFMSLEHTQMYVMNEEDACIECFKKKFKKGWWQEVEGRWRHNLRVLIITDQMDEDRLIVEREFLPNQVPI